RPVAVAAQSRPARRVLEGPVAAVVVEGIRPPPGHEQVGLAVVVVVAHGDAVPISAGERGEPRGAGDVLEGPVAPIAEEAVAEGPGRGTGRERAALDEVHVQPAVAIVVEQADPTAGYLGELTLRRGAVVEGEAEPGRLGIVAEDRDDPA